MNMQGYIFCKILWQGGGGWNGWLGRKNENGVRGKNLKNGEKREENYMKKREMGLKNASFEEKA